MHRIASILAFIVLLALHLDVWWRAPRDGGSTWLGLPPELAYRLVWIAAAWGWLLHFCAFVWTSDDEPSSEEAA